MINKDHKKFPQHARWQFQKYIVATCSQDEIFFIYVSLQITSRPEVTMLCLKQDEATGCPSH